MKLRHSIVLPEPDSPTMPSDAPGWSANVAESTMRSSPVSRGMPDLEVVDVEVRRSRIDDDLESVLGRFLVGGDDGRLEAQTFCWPLSASPMSETPNAVIVRTMPGPTSSHGADWR